MGSRDVDGLMMLVDHAITAMSTEGVIADGDRGPTREAREAHELEQQEAIVLAGTALLRFVLTRFDELVDAQQELAAQGRARGYVPEPDSGEG